MANKKREKLDMSMFDGICSTSAFTSVGIIIDDSDSDYITVVHTYNRYQIGKKSRCKIHYDGRHYPYILTGRQKYFLDEFEETIPLF